MNKRLVARQIGIVAWLIGATMGFSLPWAWPVTGPTLGREFEWRGFLALVGSIAISFAVGSLLRRWGRADEGPLFRKEAMATVGLSWVLATILGGLPFLLSGTGRSLAVEQTKADGSTLVYGQPKPPLPEPERHLVAALTAAGGRGLSLAELRLGSANEVAKTVRRLRARDADWNRAIQVTAAQGERPEAERQVRIRPIRMNVADCLFEAQSGFSTTGATVLTRIEDTQLVPRCILFWRSSTHFLGGLGIIVLFVAVLGQGSAGKALMRAEMPGPSKEGSQTRMQHTAWTFGGIYCLLTAVLAVLLHWEQMSWFDALCHSFGTMATGGFSTYDGSLGHFDSAVIDITVIIFMILAGTNFTLLYLLLVGKPQRMLADVEWRTYMAILLVVTGLVVAWGMRHNDFAPPGTRPAVAFWRALRYGSFQVVSIMTTTGYGTHNFDQWNHFGRGVLFLLTFVGGCAGSTGGGLKVIRHILFQKVVRLEIEHAFHPSVVRPLRLGGQPVDDPELHHKVLVYFCLVLVIFVLSWMFLVMIEPDATWTSSGQPLQNKLIDSASCVAATLNNIGPGLGVVGAAENYAGFSVIAKLLFIFLMMLGRLELYVILVLFVPRFWRSH